MDNKRWQEDECLKLFLKGLLSFKVYKVLSYISSQRMRGQITWSDDHRIPQGISISCPYCNVLNTFLFTPQNVDRPNKTISGSAVCTDCNKAVKVWLMEPEMIKSSFLNWKEIWISPPLEDSSKIAPIEVDEDFRKDYKEAAKTLEISPRASAALSRYCLQKLLRVKAGATQKSLHKEIQEVIDSQKLPSHINDAIDAIRNIGNFAAHPTEDRESGEIIDVTEDEAKWLIEILDSLFDFYFVQPKRTEKLVQATNEKLRAAGKPEMKKNET